MRCPLVVLSCQWAADNLSALLFALCEDMQFPGEMLAVITSKTSPSCTDGVWHHPQLLPLLLCQPVT